MTGQESPLRIITTPTLGTAVMEIADVPRQFAQWQEAQMPPVDLPSAVIPDYAPDPIQLAILDELRGLRADLASRTVAARVARAYRATISWLKGLWP